jgi:hypothetical protein
MHFKIGRSGWIVLAALACGFLLVQPVRVQSLPPNHTALKGEMKVFEAVIDETMAQTFAPPFGLLEKTKGTYLPGFGLAFSLEVNLYPLPTPTLFDPHPTSKVDLEKARKVQVERIATIKESVRRLLADHAISLRELGSDESVAVVVHLFVMQPGNTELPGQLVIETRKSDLNQFWDKHISYQELAAKMRILEL